MTLRPTGGRIRPTHSMRMSSAVGLAIAAVSVIITIMAAGIVEAWPHDWFPPSCCSGFDCKVIPQSDVRVTAHGFVIPGNPEVVPYNSPKIRQTPPEGDGDFGICTRGGKPDGEVICLYIPTWGS